MIAYSKFPRFRLFCPLLAGASFSDRLVACLGALLGIGLTSLICAYLPISAYNLPLLVAPVGSSAVLLFAIPTSPLAQPWPIIGGNMVSALVGVLVAALVPNMPLAAGLAVGGAILAMTLLRCLHPPGGAAALIPVIGGAAVAEAGYLFAFVPVALNSLILVGLGWLFHRFSSHSYPHKIAAPPVVAPAGFEIGDIDQALLDLGQAFDVSREDLDILFKRAETHAEMRRQGKRLTPIEAAPR